MIHRETGPCVLVFWSYCNKNPRVGGFKKWKFIACSSEGGKSKIKELAGLVSSEASLLGSQVATLLLPLPMVVHLCNTTSGQFLSL